MRVYYIRRFRGRLDVPRGQTPVVVTARKLFPFEVPINRLERVAPLPAALGFLRLQVPQHHQAGLEPDEQLSRTVLKKEKQQQNINVLHGISGGEDIFVHVSTHFFLFLSVNYIYFVFYTDQRPRRRYKNIN